MWTLLISLFVFANPTSETCASHLMKPTFQKSEAVMNQSIEFENTDQLYESADADEYRIYLADLDNRKKEFRIIVNKSVNPRGYKMLESYIKNGIKLDPQGHPKIGVVIGRITKTTPSKFHHFNFKFINKTVRWNDFATEACDGRLSDVENNILEWMRLGRFCPWTTRSLIVRISKNGRVLWKRPENPRIFEPAPTNLLYSTK